MSRPAHPIPAVCWREIRLPQAWPASFEPLRAGDLPWLLDSALVDGRLGRFSFAGCDPWLVLRAFGRRLEIDCRRASGTGLEPGLHVEEGDPFECARRLLPGPLTADEGLPPDLPFVGGAIACFGYELAAEVEPVSLHGLDDLGCADLTLLGVDRLLAVDHVSGRAYAVALGFGERLEQARERAAETLEVWQSRLAEDGACALPAPVQARDRCRLLATVEPEGLACSLDRSAYTAAVRAILSDIEAGRVYEANLTRRMDLPFAGDAWDLFLALRRESPAPFAAYLELPEGTLVGSSPERFLRVTADGRVESRPIKGTRPRGASPADDEALAAELLASHKDRAENLMIVDLVRNDLGRVCEIGSIAVPELMVLERYASVFQLVSTVTGRLRPGCGALDAVRAAFPPGSMTGAPKIAALRILDALEPVRRGLYSGALGYLDLRGGADLSVVIRSAFVQGGRVNLHAGGAVVADSDPDAEYVESLDKVRALFAALEQVRPRDPARPEGRGTEPPGYFPAPCLDG